MILTKRKEGETENIYQLYNKSIKIVKTQEKEIERLKVLVKKINLELLEEMEKNTVLEINSLQYN